MDDRSSIAHGFFHVDHGGQHFIFHIDQPERLVGDLERFRRHHRHAVTHKAHLVIQADLVKRQRLRVTLPAAGVLDARNILMGQYRLHSRQCSGAARVDAFNARMRMRAGQHRGVQHPRYAEIIRENRLTQGEFARVHFDLRFANDRGLLHTLWCVNQWRQGGDTPICAEELSGNVNFG